MNKGRSLFGKIVLVLVAAGILVGGGIYVGKNFLTKPTPTPTPEVMTSPSETPQKEQMTEPSTAPTKGVATKGTIKGVLGYPAEGVPPLITFAINSTDKTKYFSVKTDAGASTFEMKDVDPGTYVVIAYPQNSAQLAGGYSKAVACGLSVSCKDHTLIPVEVKAGEIATGTEVKDWYAPEGTFPTKPQ